MARQYEFRHIPALHQKYLERGTNTFGCLTPKQLQVAKELSHGLKVKDIAIKYNLSIKTVERHKYDIYFKLNPGNVAMLTRRYIYEFEIPAMVTSASSQESPKLDESIDKTLLDEKR